MEEGKTTPDVSAEASLDSLLRDMKSGSTTALFVPVRMARAQFSALLDQAANGQDVVITCDGKAKARLTSLNARSGRVVFSGTLRHLRSMPPSIEAGLSESIIRADRDGRDW